MTTQKTRRVIELYTCHVFSDRSKLIVTVYDILNHVTTHQKQLTDTFLELIHIYMTHEIHGYRVMNKNVFSILSD